ncbi:MAG: phosphate acyltransferase [Limisphaerales bacterium]
MRFIGSIYEKLQRHPKRIVFPEGTEPRIIQAARQFYSLRLGVPILLGDRTKIKQAAEGLNVSLEGVRIINPAESEELDPFARRFELVRRFKGVKEKEARAAMVKPNYFGAMMVAMHQADGLVSGTNEITGSVLRPLFQIIKTAPQTTTVALLSYSTKGSATHPTIGKVQAATALAQQRAHDQRLEVDFDGELQVDAALVPEIAFRKLPESRVAGRANVLIFPDLNSGNIASKLVQHIGRAHAYGQILLGLDRPAADVSRGSTAHDILGVAAIVGLQAIDYNLLYPGAGHKLPGEDNS